MSAVSIQSHKPFPEEAVLLLLFVSIMHFPESRKAVDVFEGSYCYSVSFLADGRKGKFGDMCVLLDFVFRLRRGELHGGTLRILLKLKQNVQIQKEGWCRYKRRDGADTKGGMV